MIFVDLKRCIGCNACSLACKQENNVRIGEQWNLVFGAESGTYPNIGVQVLPLLCQHCERATCQAICDRLGHHAIIRRDDGIVYVDQNRCVGCQQCIPVCPYKAMFFNFETNKAEKCHLCMHRIDAGLEPACVVTCLGVTRDFGRFDQLQAAQKTGQFMAGPRQVLSVMYGNLGDEPPSERPTAGYPGAIQCHESI
jgi:tetrathionate reductase subunit B